MTTKEMHDRLNHAMDILSMLSEMCSGDIDLNVCSRGMALSINDACVCVNDVDEALDAKDE